MYSFVENPPVASLLIQSKSRVFTVVLGTHPDYTSPHLPQCRRIGLFSVAQKVLDLILRNLLSSAWNAFPMSLHRPFSPSLGLYAANRLCNHLI